MAEYGEQYLQEHTMERDVLRPIRNALKLQFNLLGEIRSIVVFGYGDAWCLRRLAKKIPRVFGYEINQVAIDNARAEGFNVTRQDIAESFDPAYKASVALCDYVFEHLTDKQVATACQNMMLAAPVNVMSLTTTDDPHYKEDETHCNAKTGREWVALLDQIYKKRKWKRIFSKKAKYCYISPMSYAVYKQAKARMETLLSQCGQDIMKG